MLVPKDGNQTEPRCRLSSEYCQPILSTPVSTSESGPADYLTETMGPVPTSIRLDRIPSPTASLRDKIDYRAAKLQR